MNVSMPSMSNIVEEIANNLLDLNSPVEMPVKNHFSPGVYVREIAIPAGTVIVGKVHKTRYLNILQSGLATIITPYRKFLVAGPCTFESFEGEQKIGIIHEDCVWSTVHVTEETDVDKIVEEITASTYDEVEALKVLEGIGEKL
jgi:hypothetical protein